MAERDGPADQGATTMTTNTNPPALAGRGSVNEGSATMAARTPRASDSQKCRLRSVIHRSMQAA
jgi:hypothetical protein